jgi:hypothetical protein
VTLNSLLVTSSTTLQDFTGLKSTTTNATTTTLSITEKLKDIDNYLNIRASTAADGVWNIISSATGNKIFQIVPTGNAPAFDYASTSLRFWQGSTARGTALSTGVQTGAWNAITGNIFTTGIMGIGTSTPQWSLTISSSTGPQLALTDTTGSSNIWTQRNINGNFYLATATPGTFATSTIAALSIDTAGVITLSNSLLVTSSTTLQNISFLNGTGSKATTTNLFATIASTTQFYSQGLHPECNGSGFKVTYTTGGQFLCEVDQTSAAGSAANSKWATSTNSFVSINPNGGNNEGVGIGTSTPAWALQVSSSTRPQFALSDASLTSDIWTQRNINGNFYFATASPATFATSSIPQLTITSSGNVGVGTSSPYAKFAVQGASVAQYFGAYATTSTSTFAGGLDVSGGAINHDWSSGLTTIDNLQLGITSFDTDAGMVTWTDMPVTSASAIGTIESYTARLDGLPLLTIYSESDGAGGIRKPRVSIGTTTPYATLTVWGTSTDATLVNFVNNASSTLFTLQNSSGYAGFGTSTPQWLLQLASSTRSQLTLTDPTSGTNHWSFRNAGGIFYLATSSPSTFATSTITAFSIDTTGAPTFPSLKASSGTNCLQVDTAGLFSNTGSACGSGGTDTINSKWATSTNSFSSINLNSGNNTGVGIGTSTPAWALQVSSSTRPQFALSDASLTSNIWTMRNANGFLYFATASPATYATSSGNSSLVIDGSSGNVTIGYRNGVDNADPNRLMVRGSAAAGSTAIVVISNTDASGSNTTFGGLSLGSGPGSDFVLGKLNVGSAPYFQIRTQDDDTTRFTIDRIGHVGIGTSTPQWALQVASSSGPQLALSDASLTSDIWTMRNAGGNLYFATSSPSTFATSSVPQLTITNNGNVGIGTTTPNGKLTVINGFINLYNSTNNEALRIDPNDTGGHSEGSIGGAMIGPVFANQNLIIANNIGGSGGTVQMSNFSSAWTSMLEYTTGSKNLLLVKSGGNVGIGTTTPQWALTIASSTRPQLALTDASKTSDIWTMRNINGNFYLATSSPSTFATSTIAALSIIGGGSNGLMGIGSTTPWGKLSIEINGTSPSLVVAHNGSSTPSLYIGSANQNGFIGIGTTTLPSLARVVIDNTVTSPAGSQVAVAGMHEIYTFSPTGSNTTQVGDRLVIQNSPTSATNTAVAQIIRTIDNTSISNLVRGIEVVASAGNNTFGVNTGIRSTGHTFGLQGLTTGLAGGTSTPAAIYGENTGTTQGDILRLYTSTMTTATSVAQFYQEVSTFSGTGLLMNFGKGAGVFNGLFVDFKVNDNSRFTVASSGTTTIGQLNQITNAAGLIIPYGSICVDDDGNCNGTSTGKIAAVAYLTGRTNDLAEYFYSMETLSAGDIVSLRGGAQVGKAGTTSEAIIGVVSTNPGIALGAELAFPAGGSRHPIGLAGRIPVKLSTENGPIAVGDRIVLSSIAGIGMKEDPNKSGTVIGIALEPFDGTNALSAMTIEVQARSVPTGETTCGIVNSLTDKKAFGGNDSEGLTRAGGTNGTATVCNPVYKTLAPDAGIAGTDNTTSGMTVKVGNAMIFLNLERKTLTVSGGSIDFTKTDLDLNNHSILNVKAIASMNGKWSIDEEGNLLVESIKAKRGTFEESLEVGTDAKPNGITIYDTVTGAPYCMQVANGVMASIAGKCGSASVENPIPTPTPPTDTPPPVDIPPPDPDLTPTPSDTPPPDSTPPPDTSSEPLTVDTTVQTPIP